MAKPKGSEFEKQIQDFFRRIFEEMGFVVKQVRRQLAGTQNGFDIKVVFLNDDDKKCTLFFECKDYNSALDWSDLFSKVCELEGSNYEVDGFIVLSPKVPVSNIDDNLVPKLKSKFPFPIEYWDSNSHIEDLLALDPGVYKAIYNKECTIYNDRKSSLMKNRAIVEAIIAEKASWEIDKKVGRDRIRIDHRNEHSEMNFHESAGDQNPLLIEYAKNVQSTFANSKINLESSLGVAVENSISIGVSPISISKSEEPTDFKTDFEAVKHYSLANRFLIIEGEANSGKSVLTKRLTYFFCEEFIEGKQNLILPILIDLKTFDPLVRNLEDLIIRELRNNKLNILREGLINYLEENNFLLILDSYDECINFESLRADIFSISQKIPIILTSRSVSEIHMLKDLNPFLLSLRELSSSEQRKIVKGYLKDDDKVTLFVSLLQKQEVGGTEGNPLILKLLLLYYGQQKRLTNNIYSLYKFVLDYLLSFESGLPDGIDSVNIYYEIRKNFLRDFAFHLQVNRSTSVELKVFEEYLTSWLTGKFLSSNAGLMFAIKNNLILSSFLVTKSDQISFFHRSFQDFFASEGDNRINRDTFKNWFCEEYYHTSLKFYFARTQNAKFLKVFKPERRRLFFFKGPTYAIWIKNYSACLGVMDGSHTEEKEEIVHLIESLFLSYSHQAKSSIFLFYHISWIAPVLLSALGLLNFRAATELFFKLVNQRTKLDEYAMKAIDHFRFEPLDYESLLHFATHTRRNYVEHDNLIKQIKLHSSGLGDVAIQKHQLTSDESEQSKLRYFLREHFTNNGSCGVMPKKDVFEFILRLQIDCGGFANSFGSIIQNEDDLELSEQYNNLFYEAMTKVFQDNEQKEKKKNVLEALMYTGQHDARFEAIILAGIYDNDNDVVSASIIWLPYAFKDKRLERQYFDKLYTLYEAFPESRGSILNSINRVGHDINETEKSFIKRSINGTTYREVATALYLIRRFELYETYTILNEFLGNENYLFKLRCKVMETMIYLEPQLFLDEFNSDAIKRFNQKLLEEKDIVVIKSLIEDTLQYIGDENTLEILKLIHKKVEEDMPNRYLKEEYRKQKLHFIYPEDSTSTHNKIILPSHVSGFSDRIKRKIKRVRDFEKEIS